MVVLPASEVQRQFMNINPLCQHRDEEEGRLLNLNKQIAISKIQTGANLPSISVSKFMNIGEFIGAAIALRLDQHVFEMMYGLYHVRLTAKLMSYIKEGRILCHFREVTRDQMAKVIWFANSMEIKFYTISQTADIQQIRALQGMDNKMILQKGNFALVLSDHKDKSKLAKGLSTKSEMTAQEQLMLKLLIDHSTTAKRRHSTTSPEAKEGKMIMDLKLRPQYDEIDDENRSNKKRNSTKKSGIQFIGSYAYDDLTGKLIVGENNIKGSNSGMQFAGSVDGECHAADCNHFEKIESNNNPAILIESDDENMKSSSSLEQEVSKPKEEIKKEKDEDRVTIWVTSSDDKVAMRLYLRSGEAAGKIFQSFASLIEVPTKDIKLVTLDGISLFHDTPIQGKEGQLKLIARPVLRGGMITNVLHLPQVAKKILEYANIHTSTPSTWCANNEVEGSNWADRLSQLHGPHLLNLEEMTKLANKVNSLHDITSMTAEYQYISRILHETSDWNSLMLKALVRTTNVLSILLHDELEDPSVISGHWSLAVVEKNRQGEALQLLFFDSAASEIHLRIAQRLADILEINIVRCKVPMQRLNNSCGWHTIVNLYN